MATLERLEQALINADKAGDIQAAKMLADEIRRMRSAAPPPPTVNPAQAGANDEMVGMNGADAQNYMLTQIPGASMVRDFAYRMTGGAIGTPRDQIDAERTAFEQKDPNAALAGAISTQGVLAAIPGVMFAPGKMLSSAQKFKQFGKMTALGGAEGAAFGAGTAKQGEELQQGKMGAAFGAAAPGVMSLLSGGVKAGGAVLKGIRNVFSDVDGKILSQKQIQNMEEDVIVGLMKEQGVTMDDAVKYAKLLKGGQTTLADILDDQGRKLLESSVESTPGIRQGVKEQFKDRADDASRRIRDDIPKAIGQDIDQAYRYGDEIETARQNVQAKYYTDEVLNTEIPPEKMEAITEFLSRPKNRSLLKSARDEIERAGGEVKFTEGGNILDDGVAAADQQMIMNYRMADEILDALSDRSSALNLAGRSKKAVKLDNLRREFDMLLEDADPENLFTKGRREYGKVKAMQRAYDAGKDKFMSMDSKTLDKYLSKLKTPQEKSAFQNGATTNLFVDDNPGVLATLTRANAQDKIAKTFGGQSAKNIKDLAERESAYAATNEGVLGAVKRGAGKSAEGAITGGKAGGLPLLGHRRAYSATGLQFATADAILEAVQRAQLPTQVKQSLVKTLTSTKNPQKVLEEMMQNKQVRDALDKTGFLNAQQNFGAAQTATGVLGAVLNR